MRLGPIDILLDQPRDQRLAAPVTPQGVGLPDELIGFIEPSVGQRYFSLSDLQEKHGSTLFVVVGGLRLEV